MERKRKFYYSNIEPGIHLNDREVFDRNSFMEDLTKQPQNLNDDSMELNPYKADEVRPVLQVVRDTDQYDNFEDLNKLAELGRLERRSIVVELLRKGQPKFADMDTTIARKISGVVLRNDDPQKALDQYKNIVPSSESQRVALSVEPELFTKAYVEARDYITKHEAEIYIDLYKRTHYKTQEGDKKKKGQILWNDYYEMNQNPRRTLDMLREKGVTISIPEEFTHLLRSDSCKITEQGACPVLEKIKNEKIFTISGLKGSKASLTIHDLFDHYWTYDLLEKQGIFDRYAGFFDKVGNPQKTDMFKRESELIASTVFGTRLFRVSEVGFKPIFGFDKVKQVLDRGVEKLPETSKGNLERAKKILDPISSDSYEARSIAYVVSNMAVEIMEQRRKHGSIKTLSKNEESKIVADGILPILDPEYIALMVEIHHMILDPKNKADDALVNISALVEEYLWGISQQSEGEVVDPLVVKLENVNTYDLEKSTLPPRRIDWLRGNSGFASTKSSLC